VVFDVLVLVVVVVLLPLAPVLPAAAPGEVPGEVPVEAPPAPAPLEGGSLTLTEMVALELENWRSEAVSVMVAEPALTPYICTAPPA
jgi:hypothetical protein